MMNPFHLPFPMDPRLKELAKAGGCATAGAALGKGLVVAKGATAIGVLAKGAGLGAAAGPVGMAAGAALGLSCYALYKIATA